MIAAPRSPAGDRFPRSRSAAGTGAGAIAALVIILWATGHPTLRSEDDVVGEKATVQEQAQTIQLDQQLDGMIGSQERDGDRGKVGKLLDLEIDRLDAICGLSDAQREKCSAAAGIEARETAMAFVALRRKYRGRAVDFQTPEGQELWQQFHTDFRAIQPFVPRPGRTTSFLGRVVEGILDARQRSAWQAESDRQKREQWQRAVDRGMEQIEAQAGLTTRQHDELVAMLLEDPPALDVARIRESFGDGNPQACWYRLSQIPEARLKAIINERQWARIEPIRQQGAFMSPFFQPPPIPEE